MNWTKTNQILQTTANFGIILGLVLVGLQIKDTNRIATAEYYSQNVDQQIAGLDLLVGDYLNAAWAQAIADPLELSYQDLVVIEAYLQRQWYAVLRDQGLAEFIGGTEFRGTAQIWVGRMLVHEPALRWWAAQQNGVLSPYPEIRDEINASLVRRGGEGTEWGKDGYERLRSGPLYPESVSEQF